MSGTGRIPLTIVGGFLGSGKTTWLRHQLHHGLMQDALVMVNEAAAVPVDDMLLYLSTQIRVLAGGCACCQGLDDLIAALRAYCDARVGGKAEGPVLDHVVLETSGLADPGPIVAAIRADPVLVHHLNVAEIVVIVDALHGLRYLADEPLATRQIETADRLIVTKSDAAEPEALRRLIATLIAINPGAVMEGAVMGSPAALPDPDDARPVALASAYGTTPVLSTVLALDEGTDWTAFGIWLSALLHVRGDDIVRVKGVVRTPQGRLLLQSVRRAVQSPEILPDHVIAGKDDNSVVFIGRDFDQGRLRRSLAHFVG